MAVNIIEMPLLFLFLSLIAFSADGIDFKASVAQSNSSSSSSSASGLRFDLVEVDSPQSPIKRSFRSLSDKFNTYLRDTFRRSILLRSRIDKNFDLKKLNNITFQTADKNYDISIDASRWSTAGYLLLTYIGTPPQKQYLYYDTGSDLTWVQCQGCSTCFKQISATYSYTKSSSDNDIYCNYDSDCKVEGMRYYCSVSGYCIFEISYLDGSLNRGYMMTETFKFNQYSKSNSLSITGTFFGCSVVNKGDTSFPDGLAGYGLGPASFPSQFRYAVGRKAFSSCLVRKGLSSSSKLIMGSPAISPTGVVYTSIITDPYYYTYFYNVQVTGVSVGGSPVSIPSSAWDFKSNGDGGTIFDSGTTLTLLVRAAFDPIVAALKKKMVGKLTETSAIGGYSPCYKLAISSQLNLINYFPTITFSFKGGLKINLLGYHYMDQITSSAVCSMFEPASLNILGSYFQQNFLVVHDPQANRIGVKQVDCVTGNNR